MPITTLTTAGKVINRVAVEVGLDPVADPYASQDPAFTQLQYLLNTAGEELVQMYAWELLVKETSINTIFGDTGDYALPSDFSHMINQTGWERSQNVPLFGPLSPQDWAYLLGRDLVSSTIYASFRINEGHFKLFPQPPPEGLNISYQYMSKNWVSDGLAPASYSDEATATTDIPLLDKTLISRYLKVKFLEAKGFDTTKAQDDFNQTFALLTGTDKGAAILNAGGNWRGFPYLGGYNLPDSGYGNP